MDKAKIFNILLPHQKQSSAGVLLKAVLKNFAKCTGKHLCQSLFFSKVISLSLKLYEKGAYGTGVFLWVLQNFSERLFCRTPLDDCFKHMRVNVFWNIVFIFIFLNMLPINTKPFLVALKFATYILYGNHYKLLHVLL